MSHGKPTALPGSNLRWYLNRLRCMPPAEVPFRIRRTVAARIESLWPCGRAVPAPDLSRNGTLWLNPRPDVQACRYLEAADQIAGGRLDIFNRHAVELGFPPRWNRDPESGVEAPLKFGKLLDYRDTRLVGDIKYLWEPNRHLHLVTLAQAYALSREPRYSQALGMLLQSWLSDCPCGRGPNWSSALEPAVRLINWSLAWQLLGGVESDAFATVAGARVRDQWLRSVYQHVRFIRGFHSLYSSANNHLIGEAAGVFVAAITWPHWPETRAWAEDARELLMREALLQNAPDGVNLEQAVCYQQFVLDLLLLAWLTGRAGGMDLPPACTARIETMIEYLASIMDAGGHVPMFGDSDDGRVVRLSQEPDFCPYRSLLATGATLFGRADFRIGAVHLDDKTRWLCGSDCESRYTAASRTSGRVPVRREFPLGGYYVLGCDFNTAAEMRLVADAGPLGYGSLAAHGHADALSFTLSLGGREFLVDPGTFTYRADSRWRNYFRGTSAHNCLRIDGVDQSVAGGSFMWLQRARAGCTKWRSSARLDRFEGWHDGYTRLPDPVLHRRRIVLDKHRRRVVLEDRLEMAGTHLVELFFHFSEDCLLYNGYGGCLVKLHEIAVRLCLPEAADVRIRICRGQVSPPLGWISRGFGSRRPSPTLVWSARLTGNTLLRTMLDC